ncbi:MAG: hypothetical protein JEZ09_16700 [Salinivirgaceae bacterium]|nr:hypothetical protein [Salinivirgaceae bacterium]
MKKQYLLFIALIFGVCFCSCTYDEFVPEELPPVDTTKVYSFAADIQPIFTDNCTGCHSGSIAFSLKEGDSYGNIVPDLVNLNNPEESDIYSFPQAGTEHSSTNNYEPAQAQTVLQWIKQGAKNN